MSAEYKCSACLGKQFMATKAESIMHLDDHISFQFPAVLSHRAGVDKTLADAMAPLFDSSSMGPQALASLLKVLHMK